MTDLEKKAMEVAERVCSGDLKINARRSSWSHLYEPARRMKRERGFSAMQCVRAFEVAGLVDEADRRRCWEAVRKAIR